MKECEKYAALLDAFSEGDLFMEDMVQVQTHLMNCPDCQAYLEDLLAIRAAFPTVEETEVPEGFSARVMAAVAEHPRTAAPAAPAKQKKAPWGRVLVSLAACCAIVILMKTPILGGGGSRAEKAAVYTAETTAEAPAEPAEKRMEEPKAAAEEAAPAPTAAQGEETGNAIMDAYSYAAGAETEDFSYTETATVTTTTDGSAEESDRLLADAVSGGVYLSLTAEEAGDLLDRFTPTEETDAERLYELSAQEYISLLTALPREIRQSAPANTAETMFVIVQK